MKEFENCRNVAQAAEKLAGLRQTFAFELINDAAPKFGFTFAENDPRDDVVVRVKGDRRRCRIVGSTRLSKEGMGNTRTAQGTNPFIGNIYR